VLFHIFGSFEAKAANSLMWQLVSRFADEQNDRNFSQTAAMDASLRNLATLLFIR